MKAIVIPHHGDLDVIQEIELPTPVPAPNELLIKVEFGGVNMRDTYVRKGLYPEKKFPHILGQEAAGRVEQLPTSKAILEDPAYQRLGLKLGSRVVTRSLHAFAEYTTSPWESVNPIPDDIDTRFAVASIVQGLTALTFATEAYDIKKGDWVLIHTVAGGFGLFLTQVAHARGARIIGTTSSQEKAAIAKDFGADHVIVYTEENTVDKVLEYTGGAGVNVIYDGVGKDTFEDDFKMIARKGTLVSVGNASGAVPPFPPLKLMERNVKLLRPGLGGYMMTSEEVDRYFHELWNLLRSETLKVKIFKEYPLSAEGVRESQKDITGRGTVGKLLLCV